MGSERGEDVRITASLLTTILYSTYDLLLYYLLCIIQLIVYIIQYKHTYSSEHLTLHIT